jgi:hypothetical protein
MGEFDPPQIIVCMILRELKYLDVRIDLGFTFGFYHRQFEQNYH